MANTAAEQQLAVAMLRIQALEQTVSAERARSEMRAEMERRDRERDREAQILRAELAAQRAEHRSQLEKVTIWTEMEKREERLKSQIDKAAIRTEIAKNRTEIENKMKAELEKAAMLQQIRELQRDLARALGGDTGFDREVVLAAHVTTEPQAVPQAARSSWLRRIARQITILSWLLCPHLVRVCMRIANSS